MSDVEVLVVSVLWVVVLGLMALICLVYRQLQRAYQPEAKNVPLPVGSIAPPIEVLMEEGVSWLDFPSSSERSLLAFLDPNCKACSGFVDAIEEDLSIADAYILVSSSGPDLAERIRADPRVQSVSMANPTDIMHDFGLAAPPLLYVLRGAQIVASTSAPSVQADVLNLLETADANERLLAAQGDGYEAVVKSVLEDRAPR